MYRVVWGAIAILLKSPHKRGDVPKEVCMTHETLSISPQAWGCTDYMLLAWACVFNLPTSVGMYRVFLPQNVE